MRNCFILILILLGCCQQAFGWFKGTSNKVLQANSVSRTENVCSIQQMAQDMIEQKMNEKDLFTEIMVTLLNKLEDNNLCTENKLADICLNEKDGKRLSFQCTSEKYEKMIAEFTNKKLCYSKIAFSNTLLSSFIEQNGQYNAFTEIVQDYKVANECVDDELKAVYTSVIELLNDLKSSIADLSRKLNSEKIRAVSKKREDIIAGIFCDLRKGNQSKIIESSMAIENVGILKLNDQSYLQEVFDAFSEYYGHFPEFAKKLLEKDGLIDRLVKAHELLTAYRAKHLVNRLNEKSKGDVINNSEIIEGLNKYKNYGAKPVSGSFVELMDESEEANKEQSDNKENTKETSTAATETKKEEKPETKNEEKTETENKDVKPDTKPTAPSSSSSSSAQSDNTPAEPKKTTTESSEASSEHKNPLFTINENKPKDVREYIKELLEDLNMIEFQDGLPTGNLNTEGLKKEIETSFLSLESSTMLVKFFIKPQAVALSIIQSFVIMTPSPKKDVNIYCKKSIINGTLTDTVTDLDKTEEELVNTFATKYNLLYEKIKLDELNQLDVLKIKKGVHPVGNLSALQMDTGKQNGTLEADNKVAKDGSEGSKTPVIAIISDNNGEKVDTIVDENVNLENLSPSVDNAFKVQSGNGFSSVISSLALVSIISIYFI